MKPSGVQLASAIVPPGPHTRSSSAAARQWSGANIVPKTEVTASNAPVRERQVLGVALDEVDDQALGGRANAALLEQRRHVVDADGDTAVPGRGDRGVAASGCDIEHMPAGPEIGAVAELLGDEHDPGRDDREVAARPGALLTGLDRPELGQ